VRPSSCGLYAFEERGKDVVGVDGTDETGDGNKEDKGDEESEEEADLIVFNDNFLLRDKDRKGDPGYEDMR